MIKSIHIAFTILCIISLEACRSVPSYSERYGIAETLSATKNWNGYNIQTDSFLLRSYSFKDLISTNHITVYIEGDGLAWLSRDQPSSNPTPANPLALELALSQPKGTAIYLARPCQYVADPSCSQKYWTNMRFASNIVSSVNQAISNLKSKYSASSIELVGYSGGASIASLVAAERDDVTRIISVAGNIDHSAWTAYHKVSPLKGSLNAINSINTLKNIRQQHFVGAEDKTIPAKLMSSYLNMYPHDSEVFLTVIDNFDHSCCWIEKWPQLWAELPNKN